MKCEATVIAARCSGNKSLWGIRAQKEDTGWRFTWSFPLKEDVAKREGYDHTSMNGSFSSTQDFPGCPYCGSKAQLQCGKCGKLFCWDGKTMMAECPWCGNTGIVAACGWNNVSGGGY